MSPPLRILAGLAALTLAVTPLALTAPAAAAPPAGPVTAALPNLRTIDASTAVDSSSPKAVTAICPAGLVVVGTAGRTGGFFGDPSNNQVILEGVVPLTNSVTAQASEDEDGYAGAWGLTATAICASPPPGLVRLSNSGVSDSAARKGKAATCPSGTQLIGLGGAVISAVHGQVRLEALTAFQFLTNTQAIAAEDETGFTGNWSVQVHAICAGPLAGLQLVQAVTAAGSPSRVLGSATCPTGKQATGVGAFITMQSGAFGQVGLESLLPSPLASTNQPPTGHLAFAGEDQSGSAGTWTLTTQAICANA